MAATALQDLQPLSGWAGFPVVSTELRTLHRADDLRSFQQPRALRGNGRAYGDAAVLGNGRTFHTLAQNHFLTFDSERGLLRAEPGVTVAEILDVTMPAGWFLPVVPGTRHATLGGCIAADVHGKNHPSAGSFSRTVAELTLLTADGTEIVCSPRANAEIFWATCGGMGLTGYVRSALVQLTPIESDTMRLENTPCADLEAGLAALSMDDVDLPHAAIWIDGFAQGRHSGRGVLSRSGHARRGEAPDSSQRRPLSSPREVLLDIRPKPMARHALRPGTMRLFNQLYRAAQTRPGRSHFAGVAQSYFPLDALGNWHRLYGPQGFIQYQCVLPAESAAEGFRKILERLAAAEAPVFLAVLKRLGAEAGPLSFPKPGFTLALDIPHPSASLLALLDVLDVRVAEWGGRVYLAKDSRMKPEVLAAMYPRLGEWLEFKHRVDPQNLFQTELGRRLRLCV